MPYLLGRVSLEINEPYSQFEFSFQKKRMASYSEDNVSVVYMKFFAVLSSIAILIFRGDCLQQKFYSSKLRWISEMC
jgi:hypothetical protein